MDVGQYRKAYFALCRELRIDGDTRHAFNRSMTGRESTKEFSVEQWRKVVAQLQRDAGQDVPPGRPRIRAGEGPTPGVMITPAQMEYMAALSSRIAWCTETPAAFIRAKFLSALRRANWDGRTESLFRSEAAMAIKVMDRMAAREGR